MLAEEKPKSSEWLNTIIIRMLHNRTRGTQSCAERQCHKHKYLKSESAWNRRNTRRELIMVKPQVNHLAEKNAWHACPNMRVASPARFAGKSFDYYYCLFWSKTAFEVTFHPVGMHSRLSLAVSTRAALHEGPHSPRWQQWSLK